MVEQGRLIFVTGGARSGKSSFAQGLAEETSGRKLYIATAVGGDAEMNERIEKHRKARGPQWDTVEEADDPAAALEKSGSYGVVLLDCLTLWLTNRIEAGLADGEILAEAEVLANVCGRASATVITVSNEVGLGLVPANPLGRRFRDLAGLVNQVFSKRADMAYFVASGLPIRLK